MSHGSVSTNRRRIMLRPRRLDATGAFCILSANPCRRRRGDAGDRATTGTIGVAQQAPDDGADGDGGSDVRGGDGSGDG